MQLFIASSEIAVTRCGIYFETRSLAFYWEFGARPVLDHKRRPAKG